MLMIQVNYLMLNTILYHALLCYNTSTVYAFKALPLYSENREDELRQLMQRLQHLKPSNDTSSPPVEERRPTNPQHPRPLQPVAGYAKSPRQFQRIEEEEELKEVLIAAQPETLGHPTHGTQPGLVFLVPDVVADQGILEAEIHFNELKIPHDTSLSSSSSRQALFLQVYSPHSLNQTQSVRFPLHTKRRSSKRTSTVNEICCSPLNIAAEMDSLLMGSAHLTPSFKLRFFLVKETSKLVDNMKRRELVFLSFVDMPVMLLKYRPRVRTVRNIPHSTECGTTPLLEDCCLVRSQATLAELGWNNTSVILPEEITFNYCRGVCNSKSAQMTANARLRMTIREKRIGQDSRWQNFKFCCAPTSYSELIIHKRVNGNIRKEVIRNAVAKTCGCV